MESQMRFIHAVECCLALKRKGHECAKYMNIEHMAMQKASYNSNKYGVI